MGVIDNDLFRIWLELFRAAIMVGVFMLVWHAGKKHGTKNQKGWSLLLAGFGLLAMAGVLDITDNFPDLGRFVVIGDTPTQAFLEKIVGYAGGFIFLFFGFSAWLPIVHDIRKTNQELEARSGELESIVKVRTADLLSTNATLRDEVRERRQAEAALQKSRLGLLNAQRISNIGYWERDIATGATIWSDEIYDLFGYAPKSFAPTYDRFLSAVHPDDIDAVKAASLKAIYEHQPYDIKHRIIRSDGEIRHIHSRAEANYNSKGEPTSITGVEMDITDRKNYEKALRDSEQRFKDITEVASDWVWEMDQDLCFTYFSDRLYEALGVRNKNALGKTREELGAGDSDSDELKAHMDDLKAHRPFRNFTYTLRADDKSKKTVSISGKPVFDENGVFRGYRGSGTDITAEMEAQKKLEAAHNKLTNLANNDPLTGLPNRRNFEGHIRRAILRARRSGKPGALFYLDLNGFKKINDTYGHEHGDWALKEVAGRIMRPLREIDMVARLGGDEFCVVLEDISNEAAAAQVAEKIIAAISEPCVHLGVELELGASLGIAFFSGDDKEERIMDVLRRADQAMYRAKRDGGNVFRFFSPELHSHSARQPL